MSSYVVVTRYTPPGGRRMVHAYGAASRASGERLRRHFLRNSLPGHIEVSVCKVLFPVASWAPPLSEEDT